MIRWDVPPDGSPAKPTGPLPHAPAKPRVSAGVIPYRVAPDGSCEVFWVVRSKALRFMGGWNAFPGGRLSDSDAAVPLRGQIDGERAFLDSGQFADQPACGLRELFEEAGILPLAGPLPADAELDSARKELLADRLDFGTWLADRNLVLDASRLRYAGRWVTPPLSPLRFDATFFLLEWPPAEPRQPRVIPGELSSGEWIRPAEALERWTAGEALLAQPTLATLRVLAESGPEGRDRLWRSEAHEPNAPRPIEFRPAVRVIPLATRTLLPATHTNALLLGGRDLVLVDPGASDPAELLRLREIIDAEAERSGGGLRAIWLTHHHVDHVAGADAMRSHYSVPVWSHAATAAQLAGTGIRIEGRFEGGESVELRGPPDLRIEVLHTPGHAKGHLCFLEQRFSTLLCGDMLSGWGTVVINPPDGSMTEYLDSLDRLARLGARVALPGHGSMMPEPSEAIAKARDHRLWREQRVLEAWAGGLRDPQSMLDPVYGELHPAARPLAVRQVLAHLERLEDTGQIPPLPPGLRASLGHAGSSPA